MRTTTKKSRETPARLPNKKTTRKAKRRRKGKGRRKGKEQEKEKE